MSIMSYNNHIPYGNQAIQNLHAVELMNMRRDHENQPVYQELHQNVLKTFHCYNINLDISRILKILMKPEKVIE